MLAKRKIWRNRRIPNRATGHLAFVIKWPSGSASCSFVTSFHNAIRLFIDRLRLVPLLERDSVAAHFDAEVRKAGGGVRRITLARWTATKPMPDFFREARLAYRQLPKEHDDQDRIILYEIHES